MSASYSPAKKSFARVILNAEPWKAEKECREILCACCQNLPAKEKQKVDYLLTPAGFLAVELPQDFPGPESWQSNIASLSFFTDLAEPHIKKLLCNDLAQKLSQKARFLVLGIDFFNQNKERKTKKIKKEESKKKSKKNSKNGNLAVAELIAIIDLSEFCEGNNKCIVWTGKSYPTSGQEKRLFLVSDLASHIVHGDVAILGCHDPKVFSKRGAITNQYRLRIKNSYRVFLLLYKPKYVIHIAHFTDTWSSWSKEFDKIISCIPSVEAYVSIGVYVKWSDKCKNYTRRSEIYKVLKCSFFFRRNITHNCIDLLYCDSCSKVMVYQTNSIQKGSKFSRCWER